MAHIADSGHSSGTAIEPSRTTANRSRRLRMWLCRLSTRHRGGGGVKYRENQPSFAYNVVLFREAGSLFGLQRLHSRPLPLLLRRHQENGLDRRRTHRVVWPHPHQVIRRGPIRTWKDQSMLLPTRRDCRLHISGSRI